MSRVIVQKALQSYLQFEYMHQYVLLRRCTSV